ncbi:MAG: PEGA domain-containing protein, partial [Clostridiaceae bacterium]|nr:PEGA domain-containing protein [Clostridiaceae bacterium]
DGADTGAVTNATLDGIAVGTHTVTLRKDGYVDATAEVTIEYNATATLHLDLARAIGSIVVTSAPEGAAIFLDGTDTGRTTNATLTGVPSGEHTVTVTKPGYADATATVTVGHDKTVPVHFALTEVTGSIRVTSTPDGARIYLDGTETGEVTNATLTVPAGAHTVRVELEGYQAMAKTVTVTAGETVEAAFNLEAPVITLLPGWNFISTPKRLADGANTIALFDAVETAGHSILLYDGLNCRWETMASEDAFRPLDGVWIYANTSYTIPLAFAAGAPELPPAKDLGKGWNAIGFSDTVPESAKVTLQSLGDHWSTLIGFDAGAQEYEISIARGATGRHGDERPMQPMQGYWLYMNTAETLGSLSG